VEGELYLRLLLEECLADPSRAHFYAAAEALASLGAVPRDTAQALTADFDLAQQLRGSDVTPESLPPYMFLRIRHQQPVPDLEPAGLDSVAVAVGPVGLTTADGLLTMSWITTGRGGTLHGSLAVDPDRLPALPAPPPSVKGPRRSRPMAAASGMLAQTVTMQEPWRNLQIVDDRGTAYGCTGVSSGQTDETFTFDIELMPHPPIDARWFEIAGPDGRGVRLPVVPLAAAPTPVVTEHPRSLAELYLLHDVFAAAYHVVRIGGAPVGKSEWMSESGSVADALVGVGALLASHPLVTQARLVEQGDLRDPRLDVRLRSVLRPPHPGQAAGVREGAWPVGTAVRGPGFALRVDVITNDVSETCLFGRAQPGAHGNFRQYVFAARDDIGQWYLPGFEGGGGSDEEMSIEWRLYPRLDPAAKQLILVVIGRDAEIEIPVSLS
jgi:hypothetical protein